MKQLKIILFLIGIIGITAFSCNKNKENPLRIEDRILKIQDLLYSSCKQSTKSAENDEYLEYSTVDSNYLYIRHFNVNLNCCPDSIKVYSSIVNGKIQYSICQKESNCNCNCLYDIAFKIGPLIFTNYTLNIDVCTGSTATFTINYNSKTNGKYIIKNL
jgi:hypothetical protein